MRKLREPSHCLPRRIHRLHPFVPVMDPNADMLNDLSTALLILILSFLPFKEAVRTSVLSRQWRYLWRETTNLEFNENFFVNPGAVGEERTAQRENFIAFLRAFVARYAQPTIRRLALACSNPDAFTVDVKNTIVFATSRHVKQLELDFSDSTWAEDGPDNHEPEFSLPLHVYQHGILDSLKLYSCSFDAPGFSNFRVLKNLSLGWIPIQLSTIETLLRACPLLQSLSLKKCWNIEYFDISMTSSGLKRLIVDKCKFGQDYFSIEGPKLRYLKYSGKICDFTMENQREMVEAELDFTMETEFGEGLGTLICQLVQELYAVRVLTVCSALLQIIPSGDEPWQLETRLRVQHLILKTSLHQNEFYGIRFMLSSCPVVVTLTIDIGPGKIFPDYVPPSELNPDEFWSKNLVIQRCVQRSLRVVNVKGFKGTLNEFYVLRYLLHFGRNLNQVNIYISNADDDADGTLRGLYTARANEIMNLPKASRLAVISVF